MGLQRAALLSARITAPGYRQEYVGLVDSADYTAPHATRSVVPIEIASPRIDS